MCPRSYAMHKRSVYGKIVKLYPPEAFGLTEWPDEPPAGTDHLYMDPEWAASRMTAAGYPPYASWEKFMARPQRLGNMAV